MEKKMDRDDMGRLGVSIVQKTCCKSNWKFRELFVSDYGIDALIEYIDFTKNESINMIGLQIKCGESYLNSIEGENYVFRFDEKHKRYWETYNIPVVLIICDPTSENIFYSVICEENIINAGKNYKILIPFDSNWMLFLKCQAKKISKINKTQYNYNYMLTQLPFIEALLNGYDIILESEEWVNKSSGRGSISICVIDDECKFKYDWKYWFPFQSYENVFRKLFPWASFLIDDEFYYDDDLACYKEECCIYDSEENEYSVGEMSFDEYRKRLPEIRGINPSGELAFYKLHLKVNEFGKAFYLCNKKLTTLEIYKDIEYEENE